MAVLTPEGLAALRRALDNDGNGGTGGHPKSVWNAAYQAIEDWWELNATKQAISAAIDAATAPVVLTNAEKRKVGKFWLRDKAERGN